LSGHEVLVLNGFGGKSLFHVDGKGRDDEEDMTSAPDYNQVRSNTELYMHAQTVQLHPTTLSLQSDPSVHVLIAEYYPNIGELFNRILS